MPDHQYAHTSLGYLPTTAVRGGIKYPQRKNTMPKTQNEIALDKTRELLDLLKREERELRDKVRAERRPGPPVMSLQSMGEPWIIDVKFTPGGKKYRFLILQTRTGWYTTGTEKNAYFRSWAALLNWLEGPGVYWHNAMVRLAPDLTPGLSKPALTSWTRD